MATSLDKNKIGKEAPPVRPDAPVNILMVDDQPAKLLSYEAILRDLNENLIKVTSGREALDQLLRNEIALVLLDVSMPDIDGFELANLIRQHPRYQNTAIIFISGVHLTDMDRIRGYQRGAVDYISVPVVPDLLRAKVSVFTELYRKTREIESVNNDLRIAEEHLRYLTGRLMQIQDAERRRVARDVHDGLGQYLVGVKMGIDQLGRRLAQDPNCHESLSEISVLLDQAINETRTISHLLHPPLLDEIGLGSALAAYADGFAKRSGISVTFDVARNLGRLDSDIETALFRVVQECLLNVHRHSNSATASVSLHRDNGKIRLKICDAGVGMASPKDSEGVGLGVGLLGIRERIRQLDGKLEILSEKGKGTEVIALVPDRPRKEADGTSSAPARVKIDSSSALA
jgi:signal transduction histidine kinase